MQSEKVYDVAIVGGGLAGLSATIVLAKKGYSVILFEKEEYPFHKVCGEYISLESWNFLQELGIPLDELQLPSITHFQLSATNGKTFTTKLPLGGFGISRYTLDNSLAHLAKKAGCTLLEKAKVENIIPKENSFEILFQTKAIAAQQQVKAKVCCAAYGKRSNIDLKWKRSFLQTHNPKLNNHVAVKYHVKNNWPENLIGLHNFSGGYCGISKIEDDKYCLCYLTNSSNLKKNSNSIIKLQENVLYKNPQLKKIFTSSQVVQDFPITISQISFSEKTQVEHGILMLGDSAGMITPLCGNGMSMALHSGKIASESINQFLQGQVTRSGMEEKYQLTWKKNFNERMKTGRFLQHFFGVNILSNLFVKTLKMFPGMAAGFIKKTHGRPF
jgi:flavin-dependent dehydrogenase